MFKKKFAIACSKEASALCGFVIGFLTATIVLGAVLYYSGEFIEVMSMFDSQ